MGLVSDKGKPTERLGRKATDLSPDFAIRQCSSMFDCGVTEMVAGLPNGRTIHTSTCAFSARAYRVGGLNVRYILSKILFLSLLTLLVFPVILHITNVSVSAASLQLTWADNSPDETGFNIERALGHTGTYSIIATVGPNITTFSDANLVDGTTYCYRVNAFNAAGTSPESSEVCGTTPATPTFTLTAGSQGSGTITTNPAGINCGINCVASYKNGTVVTLQAVPASGSTFAGWSGDPDCTDGSVTMNANKSCSATFTAVANPTSFTLTVNTVGTTTPAGSGSGKIVSNPAGVDCGSKCSATFLTSTTVTLKAIPTIGSTFTGWSGDTDCLDGSVTMNNNKACAASFKLISYGLTVSLAGTGIGKVTSSLPGIDCGTSCVADYTQSAAVSLKVLPAANSVFSGWSGDADCLDGAVTMNANKSCIATFTKQTVSNIGLFRPSTGAWYLIANSTGNWQGCNIDHCIGPFGNDDDVPFIGDWNGSGTVKLGLFDTGTKTWQLDSNNSGNWQGCGADQCLNFSSSNPSGYPQLPVVGNWDGSARNSVGLYQLRSSAPTVIIERTRFGTKTRVIGGTGINGYWYLDRNGNGQLDSCTVDLCYGPFGAQGDIPVVGNWDGTGAAKIGVFTPQGGTWQLDFNGNGQWDGCSIDKCFGPFGQPGDIPVVGDWNGNNTAKIGVFRPATGEWFLDMNGNGQWDGCNVDRCVSGFGEPGDRPVVGKW